MLKLYQSNRLDLLARRLAELMGQPCSAPLVPETLVVQHPGMARWLSLELARHNGISANLSFPLPGGFVWELFRLFLGDLPAGNPYAPGQLRWRIFGELGRLPGEAVFDGLRHYLGSGEEERRFQLAERLADLYDRYLVYRPDWIRSWEAGREATPGDAWQAALWRRLAGSTGIHWVDLQGRLADYAGGKPAGLPGRVFIIGVPTLSPAYLAIVQWLSRWCDVELLLLNPCREHWAEIVTPRAMAEAELEADGSELYLEVGNPLLASLGRQGRDFFAAINEFDPGSEEGFVDPGEESLLARLQGQILRLEPPPAPGGVGPADASIGLHSCHGAMRELEVLYDQLLAMLQELPGLSPSDILVMTPDLETYAPLIQAVFGEAGDRPPLPFRVGDLSLEQGNPYAQALLELLALADSRLPVNRVLGLLEIPAVGRRFGLDQAALETLLEWVEAANIRWGRDGASKRRLGLPAEPANTWQAGLEQLLLEYAMPAQGETLWRGIAPLDRVEGGAAPWLGGLLSFSQALFELQEGLQRPRPLADWCDWLVEMSGRFFAPEADAQQPLLQIRQVIQGLREEVAGAGFSEPVSLPLVHQRIAQALRRPTLHGFLGGGIDFCSLAPMRSLPFRVICLIGMNDGLFPRDPPRLSFDLMARRFRFGDRSRRADDRYLFLETLISARERLYISYVGHDQRDNNKLPPSVLVEELRDYLAAQLTPSELARICHDHPLQPFSPANFDVSAGHFSYSQRMRRAAALVGRGERLPVPLVESPLPAEDAPEEPLELARLIRFFINPAATFARQRLNLELRSAGVLLEEQEAFSLQGFGAQELEERLVTALLAGEAVEPLYEWLRARGIWPPGNPGRREFQHRLASAGEMARRIQALERGVAQPPLDLELEVAGSRLVGRLTDLYTAGQFTFSCGGIPAYRRLALWIRHLALNCARPPGVPPRSHWLEAEGGGGFGPVEEAHGHLETLLGLYRQGLCAPLHFYPGSSWIYCEQLLRRGDPQAAMRAAAERWWGNERVPGDGEKPYHRLLLPGDAILDQAFMETSELVLRPLLEQLQGVGPGRAE